MDVEVEKKEDDNEGQIDHTDEDESIPQKASHQFKTKARTSQSEGGGAATFDKLANNLLYQNKNGPLQQHSEQIKTLPQTAPLTNQPKVVGIQAKSKQKLVEHIPCLYLPHEEGGNKIVLYFHGNAEDIGLAFDLLYLFGQRMEMHVMAIEYPGYGLYKTSKPSED